MTMKRPDLSKEKKSVNSLMDSFKDFWQQLKTSLRQLKTESQGAVADLRSALERLWRQIRSMFS